MVDHDRVALYRADEFAERLPHAHGEPRPNLIDCPHPILPNENRIHPKVRGRRVFRNDVFLGETGPPD